MDSGKEVDMDEVLKVRDYIESPAEYIDSEKF